MIVIGTRGSALALWQARHVESLLGCHGVESRIQIIKTQGDQIRHLSLDKLEGKGFFTKELEDALIEGSIDLAVHSLKDLPTTSPTGLKIAAIPVREDPAELLLIHPRAHDPGAKDVPIRSGALVGTSSNRRKAQLLSRRPDLEIAALRGNVPTRVEKLKQGSYDAILLANAGIKRLELDLEALHVFRMDPEDWIPAPGQGALGLQVREDDAATGEIIQALNNAAVESIVTAERRLLSLFQGGCHLPLGAFATMDGEELTLRAFLGAEVKDGEPEPRPWPVAHVVVKGHDAESVAQAAFARLSADIRTERRAQPPFADGSQGVQSSSPATDVASSHAKKPLARRTVVVTRATDRADALVEQLTSLGAQVVRFPTVRQEPDFDSAQVRASLGALKTGDWILFASAAGVATFLHAVREAGLQVPLDVRIGAIGAATAQALQREGLNVALVPDEAISEAFVEAFVKTSLTGIHRPRVLLPSAREGRTLVAEALRSRGCEVDQLTVYRTVLPEGDDLPDLSCIHVDYVLFMSPSAVENFARLSPWPESAESVSIGPVTSAALRANGIPLHREAREHSIEGIIRMLLG